MKQFSVIAYYIAVVFIISVHFFYYPKWLQPGTEATISWDVSGYYMYLPALFIYHDITQFKFKDEITQKYQPSPDFQQAYPHSSGNYVLKYSCGQAIQYLPFFLLANTFASSLGYAKDGFSLPYQFAISFGSLVICFIGLWYLRKSLLLFFDEWLTGWGLLILVLGTNYLDYSAITGAMTHNFLFTLYAVLIYATIQFYKNPSFGNAAAIGICVGWAALTRPTELISMLIPLSWGIYSLSSIKERFTFFKAHFAKLLLAVVITGLIGSIQIIYWKLVTGDFLVYSYQDQGFSWLRPHLRQGLFSYRAGWLTYTPMMLFALVGFIPLFKFQRKIALPLLLFSLIFIYITFAWDIWWYGGSLGQRAMVQCYPILLFPLVAFIQWIRSQKITLFTFVIISAIFIYLNLWWTHQAHKGGMFAVEQMNRAYFWKILGRYKADFPPEVVLLLDTNEGFDGLRKNLKQVYHNDFEQDTSLLCNSPIEGARSICLNQQQQHSVVYSFDLQKDAGEWLRATATFRCTLKEWDVWRMTQFIVRFQNDNQLVKEKIIRVHRLLDNGYVKDIGFDVKFPKKPFNKVLISFWNAESDKEIGIDKLRVQTFEE